MTYVKYALMAFGLIGLILCLVEKLWVVGGQGYFVMALCAIPVGIGGMTIVQKRALDRRLAGTCLAAMGLTAVKTSQGLDNIMMAAAAGALCAIALIVKPEPDPGAGAGNPAGGAPPQQ